jgi:hypothetical protein
MPTTTEPTAQEALAAAEATYRSTQDAYDAAYATSSRQALDAAETAAAQAIADAISGTGDRATADAARERVEKLRRDHEWSAVELAAAEQAMGRAYDEMVRARRGVVAQDYLAAHAAHNNAKSRVNVLLAQLPALIAELIPLVAARNELHRRLGQEFFHMPHEERPTIPQGQGLTAPPADAMPLVMVQVPRGAVADAIEAGVAKARVDAAERQRAAAHGEA